VTSRSGNFQFLGCSVTGTLTGDKNHQTGAGSVGYFSLAQAVDHAGHCPTMKPGRNQSMVPEKKVGG
jgi:hypothetical protein